ncbi:CD109 antigen-like [Daphnia pulicaria]|uniref:CD109 antigen-like n=1 Tax=Daphnia pulicaria TaxID=35523 RepID=UPI001EEB72E9|nr:CD109 antigen-like [Daphnia pulicaria]
MTVFTQPGLSNQFQQDGHYFVSPISPDNRMVLLQQQDRLLHPNFFVTASVILRPDTVYRVHVVVLPGSPDLVFKALITKGSGQHVASASSDSVDAGTSTHLLLKVPASISEGDYRLKLEGYDVQHPQKAVLIKESPLVFHSDFLSIIVQLNRKIFANAMTVRFRIILTQMDLKPYTDPITIFILDPQGFIVRRWPSRNPTNGVVSLTYQLPPTPSVGSWTIRVEAMQQVHQHQFGVEHYYIPFFEVMPSAPAYVLDSDETYTVEVTTSVHTQFVANGNLTVHVYARPVNSTADDYQLVVEELFPWNHEFTYDVNLGDVKSAIRSNSLVGWVIRVTTVLHSYFMGEARDGLIETRVIRAQLKFKFSGAKTAVFKPGMPFEGHVYVMYDDDQALTSEKLAGATITLRPVVTSTNGQMKTLPEIKVPAKGEYLNQKQEDGKMYNNEFDNWMEHQIEDVKFNQFRATGVYNFRFSVPKDAKSMRISATYKDGDGDKATAELQAVLFYSAKEMYAHVETSTEYGQLGENVVIHLRSNFGFQVYSYVVVSKGLMIHGATETHPHPTKLVTFSVPVSSEMAPTFKLVAMIVSPVGELVADSVTIPVQSFNRYKMNVTTVQVRDHSKETVQLVTRTRPGAYFGVSLLRTLSYMFQADNELTPSRVLKALYKLEPFTKSVHGVTWTDREGLKAERTEYFKGANPGADTKRTFDLAGLLLFSDARISQYPDTANCDQSNGYEPCLATGCFHKDQRCDGKADCTDGSDEDDCPSADDKMEFRLMRWSRNLDFYDWLDGDWAWFDVPTTDDGIEFHDREVAADDDSWYINAFSFHPELGFAMLDEVVVYDGSPPFYVLAESPSAVHRGETLGVRLMAINNLKEEVMTLIVLEASDDYLFVETGDDGEVEHYRPKLVGGERHHMIAVKPESYQEVYLPIAPQVEQGSIIVKIQIHTQIRQQVFEIDLEIMPEGATISRHTSLLLDLKNRAHVLRFLDIPVEESPIIPYSKFRRYVYGSPRASVTLCGDVFGPVFPSTPITTDSLLGRSLRGTEATLFNLATTLWSLHYLRLTNQLESAVLYSGLNDMNVQMAELMRLYHHDGSFRAHTNSNPSVWVTAWVIRVLGQSQFQDWENHFFVDRRLLGTSVQWILSHQTNDGSFEDPDEYFFPLELRKDSSNNSTRKGSLTAYVLIGLMKCRESLEGSMRVTTAIAELRAINYLERAISHLTDPSEIAIVTYALSIANSPTKEAAFYLLHSIKREGEGMVYWSREPVPSNQILYENQRPFLQPRLPMQQDAVAVEATSYALLVYLARDGIGDLQERVVSWLNTMRMVDGGFVSIYDSIVAMEALTEYAYRARLRDITDMSIVVEASASKIGDPVRISSETLATVHRMDIPNVWGHVNVIGRGAGQAVLQLKVQYGIDWEDLRDTPKRRYFDLYVEETYSHFRNKSHITVDACVKWMATDEMRTSGPATLEVEMPSGYEFIQSDANELVIRNNYTFIRDVFIGRGKIIWMFDRVGEERLCITYPIHRWFPVANMTLYRTAIIYESHMPEHFEMQVFNATPLYVLDICEVCGSYQCPYCPYFSASLPTFSSPFLILCSLVANAFAYLHRPYSSL